MSSEFGLDDKKIIELINANVEHEHHDYKVELNISSTSEVARSA